MIMPSYFLLYLTFLEYFNIKVSNKTVYGKRIQYLAQESMILIKIQQQRKHRREVTVEVVVVKAQ
jgi:hypothetical protein